MCPRVLLPACALALACAGARAECPAWLPAAGAGVPQLATLDEISGLAASRTNPGVLWAHNDSGDGAQLYALRADGAHLGTYTLDGVTAIDFEDLAIGPGPAPGVDYLYVGDTGNNLLARDPIAVYRVAEPAVDPQQTPAAVTLMGVDALPVQYPMSLLTNYDCETLWVDPRNADLYLVTKDTDGLRDGGVSVLFRYAAPHTVGIVQTLAQAGALALPANFFARATGGDIAPNAGALLLRTYLDAYYWPLGPAQSVADAFAAPPCVHPIGGDIQGETIAFDATAQGFHTASERAVLPAIPPLRYFAISDLEVAASTPTFVHALIGGPVTFAVDATGDAPISYQWRRGTPADPGPEIPGADGATLSIAATAPGDAGTYYCEAADADETRPSPVFTLEVDAGLPLAPAAWLALAAAALAAAGAWAGHSTSSWTRGRRGPS